MSNQTNSLQISLKQLVDKLQSEKTYFKTRVEKLKIEKKKLVISNKILKKYSCYLRKRLAKKNYCKLIHLV